MFGDVPTADRLLMPGCTHCVGNEGAGAETGRLLQDVAREVLGTEILLAVISGPTFAKELAAGLPTQITLASTDPFLGRSFSTCCTAARVSASTAILILSAQLGGAVKNVIAIGAGWSDGIGFGANARTALIVIRWVNRDVPSRAALRRSGHLMGWRV